MRLVVLAIVGCSAVAPIAPPPAVEVVPVAVAVAAAAPIAPVAPVAPLHAPPVGTLVAIALTDDGRVAATIDDTSDVRLWPALDGSVEPVVVRGLAAAQLAIGRAGDRLVIAELDAAGTLAMFGFTAAGAALGRIALDGDDATFDQIAMTPRGLVALRTDDIVELYTPWGHRDAHLVPPDGERVRALVITAGTAAGLIETVATGARAVRWIELTGTPRWGDTTPTIAHLDPANAVVSRDRRYLASADPRGLWLTELATATSRALDKPNARFQPLGFAGEDLVARRGGVVRWISNAGATLDETALDQATTPVVGGDRVIGLYGATLVLFDKARPRRFLGYAVLEVSDAPFDDALELAPPAPARPLGHELAHVALDAHHEAVLQAGNGSEWLEIHDLVTGETHPVPLDVSGESLAFDPATRMLAVSGAGHVYLLHHALDAATLGEPLTFELADPESAGPIGVTFLVGGDVLVVDQRANDTSELWRVGLATCARAGGQLVRCPHHHVVGRVVAVDRRGVAFVQRGAELAVVRDGRDVVVLPGRGYAAVTSDLADGGFALRGNSTIARYDANAQARWTIAAPLAVALVARGDTLVARGGGLARLDPIDGHVVACRHGWQFGLTDKAGVFGPAGASACTAD